MKDYSKEIINSIKQVHQELLEFEELTISDRIDQIEIINLKRPNYSRRVIIPNLLNALVRSLHEFDFVGGIVINRKNNHVIDGWHRLSIWREMGHSKIPCLIVDVNDEQEKKLFLILNRHVSQFVPSEFGFTNEFASLDLIKDFGFTKSDFIANQPELVASNDPIMKVNRVSKLIASLPEPYYRKLEDLKKVMPAPNKSEVLIKLIDFYAKHSS